jgi:S1-C subfamily serine protease
MSGQPVDADMAGPLGLDRPGGIIVSGMHSASPFLQAGVAVGDVITAVDGQEVHTPAEMIYRMSVAGMGAQARVTRLRDGKTAEVAVALIAAPDEPPRQTLALDESSLLPGLTLARINPAVMAELNLPLEVTGVAVMDSGPYGARVGLRQGDVILAVNGATVATPADVSDQMAGSRQVSMVVQRGVQRLSLQFRV